MIDGQLLYTCYPLHIFYEVCSAIIICIENCWSQIIVDGERLEHIIILLKGHAFH